MFTSDAGGSGSAGSGSDASNGGGGSTIGSGASTGASAPPACQIASAQSTLVWDVACYPEGALPAGACSDGSTSCSFCTFFECADVPDQSHSPRVFYSCTCNGGPWPCALLERA